MRICDFFVQKNSLAEKYHGVKVAISMNTTFAHRISRTARTILLLFLLLCSFVALVINPKNLKNINSDTTYFWEFFSGQLSTVHLSHALAAAFLSRLFYKHLLRSDTQCDLTALIVSCILGSFTIVGMSFVCFGDFTFLFGQKKQIIMASICFTGITTIIYLLVKILYRQLDQLKLSAVKQESSDSAACWLNRHFFFVSAVTLLLSWTILLLPFLPGSVPHDGRFQLIQYFDLRQLNLHHPYISTLIIGFVYNIGKILTESNNGATLFYVAVQSFVGALVFATVCNYIRKKTSRFVPALLALGFFALSPMWWSYVQTVAKDTFHFLAVVWFVLCFVKMLLGDANRCSFVELFISGMLIHVFRNDGRFVVLAALIIFILFFRQYRKQLCIVTLASALFIGVTGYIIPDRLGLKVLNPFEAYSIPLQQIARCVWLHEDEFTQEEKDIINAIVQYKDLGRRYNPQISDYVKNKYRGNITHGKRQKFQQLWWDKFKKYPLDYVVAALNHVFGYINPFYFNLQMGRLQLYNKPPLFKEDADIDYSAYVFSSQTRRNASAIAGLWEKLPLLSFIVNPAFYTWIGIILIGALCRKKLWRILPVFVIPTLSVLICCISPVNGLLRYTLSIMASIPLYIFITIYSIARENENHG